MLFNFLFGCAIIIQTEIKYTLLTISFSVCSALSSTLEYIYALICVIFMELWKHVDLKPFVQHWDALARLVFI